jgi:hypothetical protein
MLSNQSINSLEEVEDNDSNENFVFRYLLRPNEAIIPLAQSL